jgi:hypothetical protein
MERVRVGGIKPFLTNRSLVKRLLSFLLRTSQHLLFLVALLLCFSTIGHAETLTLHFTGAGTGSVNSAPPGIACTTNPCFGIFSTGKAVKLIPNPGSSSTFGGWSGDICTGIGNCDLTLDYDTTVTANFSLKPRLVKIGEQTYESLLAAYSYAGSGSNLKMLAMEYNEGLNLNKGTNITITGGYNSEFTTRSNFTYLNQPLILKSGSLTANGLVLSTASTNVTVPEVVGKTQTDAQAVLLYRGLNHSIGSSERSGTIPAGGVISQKPTYGSSVKRGSSVELTLSLGPVTGGTFTSDNGLASIVAPENSIPTEAGAEAPTLVALANLPPEITIEPLPVEENVTQGAAAYSFKLTNNASVTVNTTNIFTMRIPFVPKPSTTINEVKYFVRVYNTSTGKVFDIHGLVVTEGTKYMVEIYTTQLPSQFISAVVYRPTRSAVVIKPTVAKANVSSKNLVATTAIPIIPYTWTNYDGWTIWYDSNNDKVIDAVRNWLLKIFDPTDKEIEEQIAKVVGSRLAEIETIYEVNGFRPPNMTVAPFFRYNLFLIDLCKGKTSAECDKNDDNIGDSGGGVIRVDYTRLFRLDDENSQSLYDVMAHEMFHAIQSSYMPSSFVTDEDYPSDNYSVEEGTAATVAKTLAVTKRLDGAIAVRKQAHKLGEPLFMCTERADGYQYEDFFAYVAKKYGENSFRYMTGYLSKIFVDLKYNNYQMIRLNTSTFLNNDLGYGLREIYLNYVKDRSFGLDAGLLRIEDSTNTFAKYIYEGTPGSFKSGHIDLQKNDNKSTAYLMKPFTSNVYPLKTNGTIYRNQISFKLTKVSGENVSGFIGEQGNLLSGILPISSIDIEPKYLYDVGVNPDAYTDPDKFGKEIYYVILNNTYNDIEVVLNVKARLIDKIVLKTVPVVTTIKPGETISVIAKAYDIAGTEIDLKKLPTDPKTFYTWVFDPTLFKTVTYGDGMVTLTAGSRGGKVDVKVKETYTDDKLESVPLAITIDSLSGEWFNTATVTSCYPIDPKCIGYTMLSTMNFTYNNVTDSYTMIDSIPSDGVLPGSDIHYSVIINDNVVSMISIVNYMSVTFNRVYSGVLTGNTIQGIYKTKMTRNDNGDTYTVDGVFTSVRY